MHGSNMVVALCHIKGNVIVLLFKSEKIVVLFNSRREKGHDHYSQISHSLHRAYQGLELSSC